MAKSNIEHFVERFGIERCGFLTISYPDSEKITLQEFQRRYNSAKSNFLSKLIGDHMGVVEISPSGRPHLHLVVVCPVDIRTGFDFDHYYACREWQKNRRQGRKPSGTLNRCDWLVRAHTLLRARLPAYGLGRAELIPIYKTAEAVGYYLGGYLSKSIPGRSAEHKGMRFARYSRDCPRVIKGNFSWMGIHSWLWRAKLAAFAKKHDCASMEDLRAIFGPHWSYLNRAEILSMDLTEYPSGHHAKADGKGCEEMDLDAPYTCTPVPDHKKLLADEAWKTTLDSMAEMTRNTVVILEAEEKRLEALFTVEIPDDPF